MKKFGRALHRDSTELANLSLAEIREGQTYEQATLAESERSRSQLRGLCDLRSARFPGAALEHVDLRGSQIAGIHIDNSALRGTTVDPAQVADLATLLGLIVRPVDMHDD